MKIQELRTIIREVIAEELAIKESKNTKSSALNAIQKIIAENELDEADVEEAFLGFGKTKPATDEELDKWLNGNAAIKASLAKMDVEKAKKYREYVKINNADNIRKGEAILNIKWDDTKKDFVKTSAPSSGGKLGFSESKIKK